ncbi:MAG: PAS domain S-box protein, partial [Bacteroidales bacterium]
GQEFVSGNFKIANYCLKESFGRWGVLELFYEFNPLQNEDRKVLVDEMSSYLTIICDVMETFVNQHEAQHQLESTRQKYLELFESITDIVFIMDGRGRFTSINPAMQSILGYNLEQGLMYKSIIVPSGVQDVQRVFRDAITNLQSNVTFEADVLNSQGAIKNFLINCLIKYQDSRPYEILGVARDVTESRQVSRRMIKAIVETEERERKRFAEELHDSLGPLLSSIKMYLQKADASELLNDHDREIISYSSELTNEAIVQTRMIANNLMPSILSDFGVLRALKNFSAKINQLGKIRVNLKCAHQAIDLQPAESLVVYRVLTELINNALKHSRADTIDIDFHWKNNILIIVYYENGEMIHPDRIIKNHENKGMGLKNIVNRIESINGIIEFNKGNKQGFQVKILFASGYNH